MSLMRKAFAIGREYRRLRGRFYRRLEALGLAIYNVERATCNRCGRPLDDFGRCRSQSEETTA